MPLTVNDFQLATMAYFAERPLMPKALLYLRALMSKKICLLFGEMLEIRGEVLLPPLQLLIVMNEEVRIKISLRAI